MKRNGVETVSKSSITNTTLENISQLTAAMGITSASGENDGPDSGKSICANPGPPTLISLMPGSEELLAFLLPMTNKKAAMLPLASP